MDDGLTARGFWGPRPESPDRIADRLVEFLTGLDDVVGEGLPWSSPDLPGGLLTEPANARRVLSDAFGANTDAPHLGVSQAYEARVPRFGTISFTMIVGGSSDNPRIKNGVVVKWHGADAEAIADPVLRRIASAWDPDWAQVTSRSLRSALADVQPPGGRGPQVGYLTYLPEERARVLPGGVDGHLRKLESGGVVLGSAEGDGFPSVDEVRELARSLTSSEAFSATPTSRSTF
ncbi:Imm52 family immunity protein [Pseudonocardia zijingensis]|uniref:Immunity protein 52 domain-containing protein n=1 Tax=Pseudonocardia zijingensis TaxID=153376 RepID=A0ABP3ZMG1_9PSEU